MLSKITAKRIRIGNCVFLSKRCINTKDVFTQEELKTTLQSINFDKEYHVRSSLVKILQRHAEKPYIDMTLNGLIKFGKTIKDNKFTENELINAANDTLRNILILNARRLIHIRSLPYMVVLNPHISLSYSLYLQSMKEILSFPPINTIEDCDKFVPMLKDFLDKHADAIPTLSRGFTEIIGKFYPKDLAFKFLDIHLRERIIMKLTAQHFIFLMSPPSSTHIGVVDLNLNISKLIKERAEFVNELCNLKYMRNCHVNMITNNYYSSQDTMNNNSLLVDTTNPIHFPYVYENLEYTITELLKNSFRAHIENNVPYDSSIDVVVNKFYERNPSNSTRTEQIYSSHIPVLEIRIRDKGKGIHPDIKDQIYDFSFTTVKGEDDVYGDDSNRSVAGMGYGLGLSKTYLELFGGRLHVESYWGYGTDVYIRLVGPNLSSLQ